MTGVTRIMPGRRPAPAVVTSGPRPLGARTVGLTSALVVAFAGAVAAALTAAPAAAQGTTPAPAQDTTPRRPDTASSAAAGAGTEREYLARRQAATQDIRQAQRKLAELRAERIHLESRVDSAAARATAQRASELLLSHETTALRSLDSVLTVSQDNLLAQRDRFLALADAVRRRAAAELVVLVRLDSTGAAGRLDSVVVQIDSAPATHRRYGPVALDALNAGAVDEVYDSNVLPATHAVTLSASLAGATISTGAAVEVPADAITYVQFAVHNGQLGLSTWTSRGNRSP